MKIIIVPKKIMTFFALSCKGILGKSSYLVEHSSAEDVAVLWKAMGPAQSNTCSPEGQCMTTSQSAISNNSFVADVTGRGQNYRLLHIPHYEN